MWFVCYYLLGSQGRSRPTEFVL
uniref:Uncharacterized protein n=1 Tax=Rhizophora mucronata TaxID=61149 RepID=A0A2P2PF55_RHIMU